MTPLEVELLAGLRAAFAALRVYEPDLTTLHVELQNILLHAEIRERVAEKTK